MYGTVQARRYCQRTVQNPGDLLSHRDLPRMTGYRVRDPFADLKEPVIGDNVPIRVAARYQAAGEAAEPSQQLTLGFCVEPRCLYHQGYQL